MYKHLDSFLIYGLIVISFSLPLKCDAAKDAKDPKGYYGILGVKKDASTAQIKTAFRKLAKIWHPDKNQEPGAEDKFKKIGEAYEVLSDETKRRQYDQEGTFEGFQSGQTFGFGGFNFDDLFSGFNDFEEDDFHAHRQRKPFGGSHFKMFNDFNDFFDEDAYANRMGDRHRYGGGDSYFGEHFGGASSHARTQGSGRSCRTVTQKIGNTVTTYTTCT